MIKALSYCSECKSHIDDPAKTLYVDETYHRGFCSEECIEKYFTPLMNQYNKAETELRAKFECQSEDCLKLLNTQLPEPVLTSPEELYSFESESYETLYSFIKKIDSEEYGEVFYLGLGLIMQGQFSFLFMITCTQSSELLKEFRSGEKVEDVNSLLSAQELGELSELNDDEMSEIELKKSIFLAKLMEERLPSDIPFEDFMKYDEYLQETIEEPDDIFESLDEEGDQMQTFVRAFEKEGTTFFYFAFCMVRAKDENEYMIIPFMSFPTIDADLYKKYCHGKKLTGSLKN